MTRQPLKVHYIGIGPPGLVDHLRSIQLVDLAVCGTRTPAARMSVRPAEVTCNSCAASLSRTLGKQAAGYQTALGQLIAAHREEWEDLLDRELVVTALFHMA